MSERTDELTLEKDYIRGTHGRLYKRGRRKIKLSTFKRHFKVDPIRIKADGYVLCVEGWDEGFPWRGHFTLDRSGVVIGCHSSGFEHKWLGVRIIDF